MKQSILTLIFLMFSGIVVAQEEIQFFDRLIEKDWEAASNYFEPQIDLYILNENRISTKVDAKKSIASFFANNDPQSYYIKHQGKSKNAKSSYYICELTTLNGKFRLFVYFNRKLNSSAISEFRLEKL